jgi:hypothetical protein
MANYDLSRLGPQEFEHMVQALLKGAIGSGTTTFGAGQDGAREATFLGTAPYPSPSTQWSGHWIFQAKYHDVALLGVDKARKAVLRDLAKELDKIVNKYKHPCDNYILITNVPLTGAAKTGNVDVIAKSLTSEQRGYVKNIHVWSADEINRLLEQNGSVRTKYFEFLVAGDLIAKLIARQDAELDEIDRTIDSYVAVTFTREQNAQLDQAGDVSEDALKLQKLFFDLSTQPEPGEWHYQHELGEQRVNISDQYEVIHDTVRFLLSETASRAVLIGGPGEGKSTIGQYLAQLHRATLLNRLDEVAVSASYHPAFPRLPIRILLKDFGQWLAEQRDNEQVIHGTLEGYICREIERSTSRAITPTQLHQVIKNNPTLLILDGLDEVTDLALRKTLMVRINEFTARCEKVMDADLQILASTRPTGYVAQFDARTYMHLQLVRLTAEQVRGYVKRWTKAKNLEPTKEDRVVRTIDECLSDRQISVLTGTPLQITILLLIISTSGKPQYQREALFTDYLDVIYKRETAKGRNIIESDKQLLIGLHKYIGYILHENTTRAETTGGLLTVDSYSRYVEQFLRWNDPIANSDKLRRNLVSITKEAGERLVLIIEPTEGHYGFELRSIQEYFAACHLADTPADTQERYRRFDTIARLPYWRNVALFFAGRVGNRYPGEAANIIEVCLAMNREGPGALSSAGSNLAFELAADRAFGPNRRLQQRLIEVALSIFDYDHSARSVDTVCGALQRLNTSDQQEIVLPLLKQRLLSLSVEFVGPVAMALLSISPLDLDAWAALERMAATPTLRVEAVQIFLSAAGPESADRTRLASLTASLKAKEIEQLLLDYSGERVIAVIQSLRDSGVSSDLLLAGLSPLSTRAAYVFGSREHKDFLREQILKPWPTDIFDQAIRCLLIHGYMSRHDELVKAERTQQGFDLSAIVLPDSVRTGRMEKVFESELLQGQPLRQSLFWIAHLLLGDVTTDSIANYFAFFRANYRQTSMEHVFSSFSSEQFPHFDLLRTVVKSRLRSPWKALEAVFRRFSGISGRLSWLSIRESLMAGEPNSKRMPRQVHNYGVAGISDAARRAAVVKNFEGRFKLALADYAFFVRAGRPLSRDQSESLDRLIGAVASDGLLTSPRVVWIRRSTNYGTFRQVGTRHLTRLLNVLIDIQCGEINPDLLATVLISGIQNDEVSREQTRTVLEAIRMPKGKSLLSVPSFWVDHVPAYKQFLEIATEVNGSAIRECARSLLVSMIDVHQHMQSPDTGVPPIRFQHFAELHRSLARAPGDSALRSGLALFAVRRPSTEKDWELLGRLILGCQNVDSVRVIKCLKMDNWDEPRFIDRTILFLMEILPMVKFDPAKSILIGDLDVLISKSSQSLANREAELGLPLNVHQT